ncbi:MAG: adenylate/guanylate cyclase domain-containing protein [Desulfarculaceae bacterium]|nr:adenylate/guanylate cyclase domain-containing protein [Desulfarculaceae bacterium]MCF8074192.1 adenylate/guanylate cyclase domain-containing protein [Desulfarculaceae bacterium]MCF8102773.1 adenylate/guanylate cyclase domain-containing protein [Desulfarculaceae bacterium]MCF8116372.1 adenylate/guanylate cyclase domain-containing protein [Desulfarculaceae bacterium]
MDKHFRERYRLYRRLGMVLAADLEVNHILEEVRSEAKRMVPGAMEACILLLDPEAGAYTRPLQCDLYDTPRNCLSCKRNRPAVQKALTRHKAVVLNHSGSVTRPDGTVVGTGPEAAMPILVRGEALAVGTVLIEPGARFTRREFFLMRDLADIAGNHLLAAKLHWEMTQEKLRINQTLNQLTPFVPHAVRRLAEQEPGSLTGGKERRQVSVLFVDIEGYSSLFSHMPEEEVSKLVERYFSSFVDPIHRSGGDINETAGDGLMIIFQDDDPAAGAKKAVEAAFDIQATAAANNRMLGPEAQPLRVNIGINSGQALVGPSRFAGRQAARMTYTASGAVTNLAARLADLATHGDILISDQTRELTKHLWQAHPKGRHPIKGLDQPVEVWSLLKED